MSAISFTYCECSQLVLCLFFNDTATTEIYTYLHTLSLHDALPICLVNSQQCHVVAFRLVELGLFHVRLVLLLFRSRSEEHTSELQSLMRRSYAVFCLKTKKRKRTSPAAHTRQRNILRITSQDE